MSRTDGDPNAAERLAPHFAPPFFARRVMAAAALSPAHLRTFFEQSVGPFQKLVESFANDPARLGGLRSEVEALVAEYFEDNIVRQDYLLTRAQAR